MFYTVIKHVCKVTTVIADQNIGAPYKNTWKCHQGLGEAFGNDALPYQEEPSCIFHEHLYRHVADTMAIGCAGGIGKSCNILHIPLK